MSTIDHVTFRVQDLGRSRRFYDRVFELLAFDGKRYDSDFGVEWGDFSLAPSDPEHPLTTNVHIAFSAASHEQIDTWWKTLIEAGYTDDGAPGVRPQYSPDYYGAFVRDPDGNSVEAVQHESTATRPGLIDHLWIRVPDLERASHFYMAVAPTLDLSVTDGGERIHLRATGASFALLEGEQLSENLHLAIGLNSISEIAEFHRRALAAGGTDNGGPGERPQYHPGYYGAYILDPAGTNLEAVFHDRRLAST
jgi:catechol 2,3-dioxygenase-like lactoylglutathione lyase family enzyme